jgi:hypothetical protein
VFTQPAHSQHNKHNTKHTLSFFLALLFFQLTPGGGCMSSIPLPTLLTPGRLPRAVVVWCGVVWCGVVWCVVLQQAAAAARAWL